MALGFRSLIISILALWRDLSWKQIGAAAGLTSDRLSKILRRQDMADKEFDRLLPHVARRPAEVLVVTRCLEELGALEREQDLTDEEQEEVERGLLEASRLLRAELVAGVRRSRRAPSLDAYPTPSEVEPARWQAETAWRALQGIEEEHWPVVVKAVRELQSWALVERVCEESVVQASRDLKSAASLARLAEEIAALVRGPEGWRRRVQGYAAAHGPNIERVRGQLKTARAGMDRAFQLWDAGADPDGVLDPGRLLNLEGALCRSERRFARSIAVLDEARLLSPHPELSLVQKGFTLEVMGEYERAIETLRQAQPLVEQRGDTRLLYMWAFNLAVNCCHRERFAEAAELARAVYELAMARGDQNELSRVTWLEGRIAAGLGFSAKALTLLDHTAQEFAARGMWYDVALAQFEIARLLLEEGRSAEVQELALSLREIFEAQGVHREALAALRLFCGAVTRGEATTELARRVLHFLFRARYDQSLQFTPSGTLGTTEGIHPTAIVECSLAGSVAPAGGVPTTSRIESVLIGTAPAVGVPTAAFIDGRAVPEGGERSPELLQEGEVARGRGEERGGESEGNKSWTHERVSNAAPGSDLPGPRGPRLPDMVRQTEGKKSPLALAVARLRLKTLLVRLFRALTGQTQKEFAEALCIDPAVVAQCELGKHDPGPGLLERMARRASLTVREGEEVLHFVEVLRRPRQRAGLGLEDLADDLAAVTTRAYGRLLRLPIVSHPPRAEDRHSLQELWSYLKDLSEEQQLAVVIVGREYHHWALAEYFADQSILELSRDIKRAISLACLAREVASRVTGSEGWRNCLLGYALAAEPNCQRVVGDLKAARSGIERAKEFWRTGHDPECLLDPARLLNIEGALYREERQFREALACLDRAAEVGRFPELALIQKGFTLEVMGEYEKAIETLLRAMPLVNPETEPRQAYMLRFNLAVNYTHLEDYEAAIRLVEQVRETAVARGDAHEVIRVTWLEGRIAAGLGRNAVAVRLLDQARQEFAARNMWYNVALAELEMAPLLLAEGAVAQVRQMAADLVVKFEEQGVHREALAALTLFREAAEREEATADLARRVLAFLFRARFDEELRFAAS